MTKTNTDAVRRETLRIWLAALERLQRMEPTPVVVAQIDERLKLINSMEQETRGNERTTA